MAHGFVAPRHVGSSRTGARTRVPSSGRQILNHCATREAPLLAILNSPDASLFPPQSNVPPMTSLVKQLAWEAPGRSSTFKDKKTPLHGGSYVFQAPLECGPKRTKRWFPGSRSPGTPPPENKYSALREGVIAKLQP